MILVQPQMEQMKEYEALAQKEDLGFEVLELSFPSIMESPNLTSLTAAYKGKPIDSLHGAFIDLNVASTDPEICATSQKRCRQSCQTAKALGVKSVIFHTGFSPYLKDPHYQSMWAKRSAEFYLNLIDEFDMNLYIENFLDQNPEMLLLLMQTAEHPRLRVCLDVGHVNFSDTPVAIWFQTLQKYIGYLHLSDNFGKYDEHLSIGRGAIDWSEINRHCKALCQAVSPTKLSVTLEPTGISRQTESIRYLRENKFFPYGG